LKWPTMITTISATAPVRGTCPRHEFTRARRDGRGVLGDALSGDLSAAKTTEKPKLKAVAQPVGGR